MRTQYLLCAYHLALQGERRRDARMRVEGRLTPKELVREWRRQRRRREQAWSVFLGWLRSDAGRATLSRVKLPVRVGKALRVLAEPDDREHR